MITDSVTQCRRGKAFLCCTDLYGLEFSTSTLRQSRSNVLVGYYDWYCGPVEGLIASEIIWARQLRHSRCLMSDSRCPLTSV